MATVVQHSEGQLMRLLAIIRLGDVDRLGWWRSHSLNETAEYVLGNAFPDTWMATGLELAMESARLRHDEALGRATAVHIFSDYLPFHRLLRSWLIERKLQRDLAPLAWAREAGTVELRTMLGPTMATERRAGGLYVGDVRRKDLANPEAVAELLDRLACAYAALGDEFVAPYLDIAV